MKTTSYRIVIPALVLSATRARHWNSTVRRCLFAWSRYAEPLLRHIVLPNRAQSLHSQLLWNSPDHLKSIAY
jgi:hypothetical protein